MRTYSALANRILITIDAGEEVNWLTLSRISCLLNRLDKTVQVSKHLMYDLDTESLVVHLS